MSVPIKERYFEDYVVGEVLTFGDHTITEQEIIEFASRYDPQYFHIDPEAAADSHYGGLIASGWQTGSIMMGMMVQGFVSPLSSMGSPGLDELRWPKPVRPGDRLYARATVDAARKSQSRPDRGIVHATWELLNQHDEVVMRVRGVGMYLTRPVQTG